MDLKSKLLNATRKKRFESERYDICVDIREMTAQERVDMYTEAETAGKGNTAAIEQFFSTSLIIAGVLDPETGNPVFTQADAEAVHNMPGGLFNALSMAIAKLSGVDPEAVEQETKN